VEEKILGKSVDDAGRNGDKFGEGSCASILAARHTENLAAITKIYVSAATVRALSAVHGRVEGDAVSFREAGDSFADVGDSSRRFVSHDDRGNAAPGGSIIAVDVATADSACGDAD
jgi:hypothetical protein